MYSTKALIQPVHLTFKIVPPTKNAKGINNLVLNCTCKYFPNLFHFKVCFDCCFPPEQNAGKLEQYSWSFFKAICHMISIGFGRFPPMNVTEMWMTTFSIMLGATFYALFIGTMSTLLLAVDASGRLYNERVGPQRHRDRCRIYDINDVD